MADSYIIWNKRKYTSTYLLRLDLHRAGYSKAENILNNMADTIDDAIRIWDEWKDYIPCELEYVREAV